MWLCWMCGMSEIIPLYWVSLCWVSWRRIWPLNGTLKSRHERFWHCPSRFWNERLYIVVILSPENFWDCIRLVTHALLNVLHTLRILQNNPRMRPRLWPYISRNSFENCFCRVSAVDSAIAKHCPLLPWPRSRCRIKHTWGLYPKTNYGRN
jgi:hypothetical protein